MHRWLICPVGTDSVFSEVRTGFVYNQMNVGLQSVKHLYFLFSFKSNNAYKEGHPAEG